MDGSGVGSASEQQDFFFGVFGRAFRDSTNGRTCSGGSTPFSSAQVSFSSMVKQQQSPFQHWSAVRQPHGRLWHGYGTPPDGLLRFGAGNGNPNVTIRWLTKVSTTMTPRRRKTGVRQKLFRITDSASPKMYLRRSNANSRPRCRVRPLPGTAWDSRLFGPDHVLEAENGSGPFFSALRLHRSSTGVYPAVAACTRTQEAEVIGLQPDVLTARAGSATVRSNGRLPRSRGARPRTPLGRSQPVQPCVGSRQFVREDAVSDSRPED